MTGKEEIKKRTREIYNVLPKLDDHICGYSTCGQFARAVAEGRAPCNGCITGGPEVAAEVCRITGVDIPEDKPRPKYPGTSTPSMVSPQRKGKGKKVAITGKGGSGKTMLTAILTRILANEKVPRILAIDADSSVNLPYALGVEIRETVSEIRQRLIEEPGAKAAVRDRHIRDVMAEAIEWGEGFDMLVMGRPEGPGCYCGINDLLRYGIDSLSGEYDVVLIDCEAGPEQVNRRVVNGVDVLVIVTDASVRGIRVARSIMEVVQRDASMKQTRTGLVINRSKGDDTVIRESAAEWGLDILGSVPEDEMVTEYDSVGRPIVDLPDTSPSVAAVRTILDKLLE